MWRYLAFIHSPIAFAYFAGRRVIIRAIKPIKAGDEINITYIEVGDSTEKRRRELKEHFFFDCECPRCEANLPKVTAITSKYSFSTSFFNPP